MVKCGFDECENEFLPGKHNKKYCSQQCSIKANNKKAMARYNERKQQLQNGRRVCASIGCGTILRKENPYDKCEPCMSLEQRLKKEEQRRRLFETVTTKR